MAPPRFGPLEIGDTRKHPGREPSDFPETESATETRSQAATVASFHSSRFQMGVPAAVLCCLITTVGGFVTAWASKPSETVALSDNDRQALQDCRDLKQQVGRIELKQENFQNWIEPQIGVILVQLNAKPYAPPAPQAKP